MSLAYGVAPQEIRDTWTGEDYLNTLAYLDRQPETSRVLDVHLSKMLQYLGGVSDWRDASLFYPRPQLTTEESDELLLGWLKENKRNG